MLKMTNLELLADYSEFLKEKKEEGKKVIAFISHDNLPEELIDAAGFIPLRMIFAGNDELMDASHDYLPPSTCAFAQSCIGAFVVKPSYFKFLDLIDYFIVSNFCVSDICASEIVSKYFNIPRLNFYVSYIKNSNGLKYFKLELNDLKKNLEEVIGKQIKDEYILASIKKYNDFKKKLVEFNDLKIKGSIKLKILHKAMLFGPDFIKELENSIIKYQGNQIKSNTKDIILTGCSIFVNDFLIELIEEGGGNVVMFDTWIGSNYFSQVFDEGTLSSIKDPIELLTHRFNNNYGDHSIPNSLENQISQILQFHNNYSSQTGKKLGVINHIIKFCDHISIMASHLKIKLQEKGIPVLNLERDYSRSARAALETRVHAFLEMLTN
ncbi:hypothetical protein LCGC14_0966950 [marine sediment metagenome]|uniref:2-hydroxyacyl-CoA dehydratase n=1 Tax=marine sediment metagenome TaxID=412755 RepID=A0A0F9NH98_9ZZZZ|nr:MAG: Benzoyl-CoA reductase subunit C [Candidatus Lokiarchaeum sp. GC14_75]